MLRTALSSRVESALYRLIASGELPNGARVPVEIQDTKNPEHGDYATNVAMVAAKPAGMNPRALAEKLAAALSSEELFEAVEIAGPGFINFRLKPEAVSAHVADVLKAGDALPSLAAAQGPTPSAQRPLKINVEFVSVNPNGPITVGSGRGAAFGDTLCRVLQAAGHEVNREYYINDGVNSEKMRLFAESVRAYATGSELPEKGYKGEYVQDVARALDGGDKDAPVTWWQERSQELMLQRQRTDLSLFGVQFDTWFSEQSLHDSGAVGQRIQELQAKGAADKEPFRTKLKLGKNGQIEELIREQQPVDEEDDANIGHGAPSVEGVSHPPLPEQPELKTTSDASETRNLKSESANTLWLRSTKFGDDMDRVLRRKDGRLTYIASDVAYHADKFIRPPNADKLITVLGPDHHGYIARLHAVLAALELDGTDQTDKTNEDRALSEMEAQLYSSPEERDACLAALKKAREELEVVIFQIVRFVKDGKPAPMRKRDGNIYELRDLILELGQAQAPNAPKEEQERIGADVARFFYLMRSHDTHMDFDIDLATKQSDENPVFYVQYAHARIAGVLRKATEAGLSESTNNLTLLEHPRELALIKKILDLPYEVQRAAKDYGVHRLTTYAVELARSFHHFYDACRVIQPDQPDLSGARLALCRAAQIGLKGALNLLGVSAPERMERAAAEV